MPDVMDAPFVAAGAFLSTARQAFLAEGVEVQTSRVAGGDLASTLPQIRSSLDSWADQTEAMARSHGIEYLSLGRLPASAHEVVSEQMASVLAAGETVFFSADLISGRLPSVAMAQACAHAVKQLAATTPQGFGNLRFAATAHCPPNIPFLPAAYHSGGAPKFALAVQAADVVVDAFDAPGGISDIEDRLVAGLEAACAPV